MSTPKVLCTFFKLEIGLKLQCSGLARGLDALSFVACTSTTCMCTSTCTACGSPGQHTAGAAHGRKPCARTANYTMPCFDDGAQHRPAAPAAGSAATPAPRAQPAKMPPRAPRTYITPRLRVTFSGSLDAISQPARPSSHHNTEPPSPSKRQTPVFERLGGVRV